MSGAAKTESHHSLDSFHPTMATRGCRSVFGSVWTLWQQSDPVSPQDPSALGAGAQGGKEQELEIREETRPENAADSLQKDDPSSFDVDMFPPGAALHQCQEMTNEAGKSRGSCSCSTKGRLQVPAAPTPINHGEKGLSAPLRAPEPSQGRGGRGKLHVGTFGNDHPHPGGCSRSALLGWQVWQEKLELPGQGWHKTTGQVKKEIESRGKIKPEFFTVTSSSFFLKSSLEALSI